MQDPLTLLTFVAVILLVGVLLSIFAQRIRVPDVLFLVLFGLYLGSIQYGGEPLFEFPIDLVTAIAILALTMVVFDSTTKIKIKSMDTLAAGTAKVVFTFLFVMLIGMTYFAMTLFDLSLGMALLFAAVMAGTAPSVVLPMLHGYTKRSIKILQFESLFNTPLTVLLPFLIIDLMQSVSTSLSSTIVEQLGPFLAKFVSGIGAGIFVGIILFQTLKYSYSSLWSPLEVVLAALLSFVLAENLGGNGVLAVTTLGIFFGNTLKKQKMELLGAGSILARSLYILVFVILGATIKVPSDPVFFTKSLTLFGAYLGLRFLAMSWSTRNQPISYKEQIFMSLAGAKGIAVAVVAFALTTLNMPQISIVLDLTVAFILYSILTASIATWMVDYFMEKG